MIHKDCFKYLRLQTSFPYQVGPVVVLGPWTGEEKFLDPLTGEVEIHPVGESLED